MEHTLILQQYEGIIQRLYRALENQCIELIAIYGPEPSRWPTTMKLAVLTLEQEAKHCPAGLDLVPAFLTFSKTNMD